MADFDEMHAAYKRAGEERDIISFLETEVRIAESEGDKFLVNIYGQAIREIQRLRDLNDAYKAEIQYYQQLTRE